MENTAKQVSNERKRLKDIKDAGLLFEKWIKKYLKTGDLKKSRLRQDVNGRYVGKTIFMDIVSSAEFTPKEKYLLFACLFTMHPETLTAFEPLYIKSSKNKFIKLLNEVEDNRDNSKELFDLYGKAIQMNEANILTVDELNYVKEKYFKMIRKHGKYADLYKEVDAKIKYAKENGTGQFFQKSIIITILEKHISAGDHYELNEAYKNNGNSMIKLYDNFKSAYIGYKKSLP